MRWWNAACCLCAVVCVSAAAHAQETRSDAQILIQLERDWDAALRRKDTAVIDRLLADEFVGTYDDGSRADKRRELELAAAFNQQIDSSRLEDFTIQLHGDTAVVMFTLHLSGPVQGRPTDLALRYLDVWVKRDGRWLCVASQSTRIRAVSEPQPR
jgi:ketosteroid isomerase-like protein